MWSKLDDQFYLNTKNATIDRDEQDLYMAGLVYCNGQLTDGFIPTAVVQMLCIWAKIPYEANAQAIANHLVEHRYWENAEGGFMVHDFLDWNISKAEALELKQARSDAGKRGGLVSAAKSHAKQAKRQASAQASAQAKSKQSSTQSQYPIPAPDPAPEPDTQKSEDAFLGDRLFSLAKSLSEVTGISFEANRPRMFKEAKELSKDITATAEKIKCDYGSGGLWYQVDWRGKKGQPPTLAQVRSTFGSLKLNGNGSHPNESEPKGFAAIRSFAKKEGMNDPTIQ